MTDKVNRIPLPSQQSLLKQLRYEVDTGLLWWKEKKINRQMDKSCGTLHHNGYLYLRMDGRLYTLHRVIWKMVTGREPDHLDHINGCRIDNRLSNLREVSRNQNNRSIGITKANSSGYIGVRFSEKEKCWTTQITVERKRISLGRFKDKRQAVEAYNRKAIELHSHFAMRKVQHNIEMLVKEFGGNHDDSNHNTCE